MLSDFSSSSVYSKPSRSLGSVRKCSTYVKINNTRYLLESVLLASGILGEGVLTLFCSNAFLES